MPGGLKAPLFLRASHVDHFPLSHRVCHAQHLASHFASQKRFVRQCGAQHRMRELAEATVPKMGEISKRIRGVRSSEPTRRDPHFSQ